MALSEKEIWKEKPPKLKYSKMPRIWKEKSCEMSCVHFWEYWVYFDITSKCSNSEEVRGKIWKIGDFFRMQIWSCDRRIKGVHSLGEALSLITKPGNHVQNGKIQRYKSCTNLFFQNRLPGIFPSRSWAQAPQKHLWGPKVLTWCTRDFCWFVHFHAFFRFLPKSLISRASSLQFFTQKLG